MCVWKDYWQAWTRWITPVWRDQLHCFINTRGRVRLSRWTSWLQIQAFGVTIQNLHRLFGCCRLKVYDISMPWRWCLRHLLRNYWLPGGFHHCPVLCDRSTGVPDTTSNTYQALHVNQKVSLRFNTECLRETWQSDMWIVKFHRFYSLIAFMLVVFIWCQA
jgi:hypothetical protein